MEFLIDCKEQKYFKMEYRNASLYMVLYSMKGILFLSAQRYGKLKSVLAELHHSLLNIDQSPVKTYFYLGGNIYAYVISRFRCIQIRKFKYYAFTQKSYPTKNGISLKIHQWEIFCSHLEHMEIIHPLFLVVNACIHTNKTDYNNCVECLPPGLGSEFI